MFRFIVLAAVVSSVSWANVAGPKVEVLGSQYQINDFDSWVSSKDAVMTPETTHLVIQACFRKSQEQIDQVAYALVNELASEFTKTYPLGAKGAGANSYETGLAALAQILKGIQTITAESAGEYTKACKTYFNTKLNETVQIGTRTEAVRALLEPLYEGRMRPRLSEKLPAEVKEQLLKLLSRGIQLAPLTWDDLGTSVCELEGYYSTSRDERLWKFFSSTRIMANVLPDVDRSEEFVKAATRSGKAVALINALNEYSSVAGKYNGASIGMSSAEIEKAPVRLTGPALGSNAAALMAFFTTAWREQIQLHVINQNYPTEPFELVSSGDVLGFLQATANELKGSRTPSATEWGMSLAWNSIFYQFVRFVKPPDEAKELGKNTTEFDRTSALAWVALNAETNVRQNEKIAGLKEAAIVREPTRRVFGTKAEYESLAREIALALNAYRVVDPQGENTPYCVTAADEFSKAAALKLGDTSGLGDLDNNESSFLASIEFKPVIVDIGLEVDDTAGTNPEGVHRLHLATGYGREIPVEIKGKPYTVWTPSAMVLHLDALTTTAQWQGGLVEEYDKAGSR